MKPSKIFGICIILLMTVVSASAFNETALDELLSNYDLGYSDGTFNVQFEASKSNYADYGEAGSVDLNFTISGSGASSDYSVKAKIKITNDNGAKEFTNYYEIPEASFSTPGLKTFTMDGNYFHCNRTSNDGAVANNKFDVEFKIIQNDMTAYEKTISFIGECSSKPIQTYSNFGITGIAWNDTGGDSKYEGVTATIELTFSEAGTYDIGLYLTDNKTKTAYAETTYVAATSESSAYPSIYFDADLFKYFNLSNEFLLVKSIYVNGHKIDDIPGKDYSPEAEGYRYYDWYWYFNGMYADPYLFSSGDFFFDEVYADSYSFTKTESNGKITELIANVNMNAVSGTYDVEASLVNEVGEFVDVVTTTVSSNGVLSIPFNGTHIYESKVNGPYKLGYLKIYSGDTTYHYVENKGLSEMLSSYNFTAPDMSDVVISDSDVLANGNDIDVTVHNDGSAEAVGITVSLYDSNAQKIEEAIIDKISAGSDAVYTFSNVGLSSAIVVADFKNQIEESNESNNIGSVNSLQSELAVFAYIYNKNQKEYNSLDVPINANVSFDGNIREAFAAEEPAMFDVPVDTLYSIGVSSDGFQPITGNFFFDQRLLTCSEGSDCLFTNTYDTVCDWEDISWLCSSNGMSYRFYHNPARIKISGYLVEN